jgi:hypothetical protein
MGVAARAGMAQPPRLNTQPQKPFVWLASLVCMLGVVRLESTLLVQSHFLEMVLQDYHQFLALQSISQRARLPMKPYV